MGGHSLEGMTTSAAKLNFITDACKRLLFYSWSDVSQAALLRETQGSCLRLKMS